MYSGAFQTSQKRLRKLFDMSKKLSTYQKNETNKPKIKVAQTPAEPMFEPRYFGMESQQAPTKPVNLNTKLMRAQRYGHNLTQIPRSEPAHTTPVQPKKMRGQPLPSQQETKPIMLAKPTIGERGDKSEHETEQYRADQHRLPLKSHTNTINAVQCMMDSSSEPQEQEELSPEEKRLKKLGIKYGSRFPLVRRKANALGEAVREQVRVQSVAPGIIHTRIHRPVADNPSLTENDRNAINNQRPGEIMEHMGVGDTGDTYDRLRVHQGAGNGGVLGGDNKEARKEPSNFASKLNPNTAVINGGFFSTHAHEGNEKAIGLPVGETSHRTAKFPIPKPYLGDYGALNVNDKVGISSGPVLEPSKGDKMFEDNRFKHNIHDPNTDKRKPNLLNNVPGALTHASGRNPRSAISTFPPINGESGDVIMHTVTTGGVRDEKTRGATMEGWQKIVTQGSYQYGKDEGSDEENAIKQTQTRPNTLNLDGGGSVYMGIKNGSGMHTIASGAQTGEAQRKIPNIVFAGGENDKGGEVTIVPNQGSQQQPNQNPLPKRRADEEMEQSSSRRQRR